VRGAGGWFHRQQRVRIAAALATVLAGVALGRWLDPTPRASGRLGVSPFAFPDFAFAGPGGTPTSRRALAGRPWLATVAAPTCDASGRALPGNLEVVTFWVGAGDDWRSMEGRGAPAETRRRHVLAADAAADGRFLASLSGALGGGIAPDDLETWTKSAFVVDEGGVVRAVYGLDARAVSPVPALPSLPAALRGKVVIVDFIFTSCRGVCPMLSARMVSLQHKLPGPAYAFASFSVDPERDTPAVLEAYAERWTSRPDRWHLLVTQAPAGLAHSDRFLLLGAEGAMRGSYAVLEPGELERLEKDARALVATAAEERRVQSGEEGLHVLGCMGCHGEPSLAPSLAALAGRPVRLAGGQTITADDGYLRRSILDPRAQLVTGYGPTMPSYAGSLDDAELAAIVGALHRLRP
jgi:cytochrome oxidase Cu insertion factor (SCO1/SenC/PrrC family)